MIYMNIEIHYCAQWDYKPNAVSLAAELEDNLSLTAELFPEGQGIFDVVFNGQIVYSKYDEHRFPNAGEVTEIIRRRQVLLPNWLALKQHANRKLPQTNLPSPRFKHRRLQQPFKAKKVSYLGQYSHR